MVKSMVLGGLFRYRFRIAHQEMTPGPFDAVEVSIVRWHKDNQFGIEFPRYAQGNHERVTDLVEGREVPAISSQPNEAELTLSLVAA